MSSIGMFLEEAGNPISLTPHTLNLQREHGIILEK